MSTVARPVVAPPEPWDFPEGQAHDLPNGLRLLTYDVPGQYVVSVRSVSSGWSASLLVSAR